jgi:RNA polymerase sigma-70 factor (ECF subfamily)
VVEAVITGGELMVTAGSKDEVYHPAGLRSDQDLVREVLAGNVEAFAGLVRRYRQTYARFATRMLGDRDDAEDALQSAFLRAFRGLVQCAEPERFGAWLYRIVVNECRTAASRRGRRGQVLVRNPVALAAAVDEQDYSWSLAVRHEIQHALNQLPSDQREAFLLKYVEELSYDEMAELTGAGVSALKMRVKRASARLRELLEEAFHESR